MLAGCEAFGPMKRIRVEYQPKEIYRYVSDLFRLIKETQGNDPAFKEIFDISERAKDRGVIDNYKVYSFGPTIKVRFAMVLNGKPFTTIITKDENGNVMARNYPLE